MRNPARMIASPASAAAADLAGGGKPTLAYRETPPSPPDALPPEKASGDG